MTISDIFADESPGAITAPRLKPKIKTSRRTRIIEKLCRLPVRGGQEMLGNFDVSTAVPAPTTSAVPASMTINHPATSCRFANVECQGKCPFAPVSVRPADGIYIRGLADNALQLTTAVSRLSQLRKRGIHYLAIRFKRKGNCCFSEQGADQFDQTGKGRKAHMLRFRVSLIALAHGRLS